MKKTTIYFVEVEGTRLQDVWSGIFDEPVKKCDILNAMEIDIADLEVGSEHELELADNFQLLRDIIDNTSQIVKGTIQVKVANCIIGKIHITTRDMFTN